MIAPRSLLSIVAMAGRPAISLVIVCLAAAPVAAQQAGKPAADAKPGAGNTAAGNVPKSTQEKQFPLGASWVVIAMNGKPIAGERPTLLLDEALRARGFGGCNTYSATAYPLRQQGFAVGPIAATKKACTAEQMNVEKSFFVMFRTSQKFDLEAGQLVLTGQAGQLRLERGI